MKPNVIDLQDCGLVDEHLEELLAFMKNKEMVTIKFEHEGRVRRG